MTSPALDMAADQADGQVRPLVPLRRNLQFQTLWVGSVTSSLGLAWEMSPTRWRSSG